MTAPLWTRRQLLVTGSALAIVLWNVRKYMITTREPWSTALSECLAQLKLTGQGSAAIKTSAQRLHALGWELPPVMRVFLPKELEKAS